MYQVISSDSAKKIIGGNDYIYKCWDKQGKEYWSNRPNAAGCTNTVTGKTEYDRKNPQPGGGK